MGPHNRPLDLEWLEDFLALAEAGNFSRAAQARHIAQPAFSRHIRSLEEWAGAELIDRSRHPASPTPAGEVLLAASRDVVLRLLQARARALEVQGDSALNLRFAATHVLSLAFFPGWLQRIERGLSSELGPIHMSTDSFRACQELLLQRRVQFLLCYGDPAVPTLLQPPGFESAIVGTDRVLPVAVPELAATLDADLRSVDRLPVPMLAYNEESWLGRIMRVRLAPVHDPARFRPAVTSHHTGLLKNLALAGRGLAWLPASLVEAELRDGRLVAADRTSVTEPGPWRMPVDIHLFRATSGNTPMADTLWRLAIAA